MLLSKTAVCIGDQLLDFSLPELVRSQSTFSNDQKSFRIAQVSLSAGLAVGKCSAVMGSIPCILWVHIYCVVCIGLLSAEFSSVNTGLGRPMFWKPMCLLSTPEGLAATIVTLKNTGLETLEKVLFYVSHHVFFVGMCTLVCSRHMGKPNLNNACLF